MSTSPPNIIVTPTRPNVTVTGGPSITTLHSQPSLTVASQQPQLAVSSLQPSLTVAPTQPNITVNFGPVGARGEQGPAGASGGSLLTRTAAENISALYAVVSTTGDNVVVASPATPSHFGKVVGVATTAATAGQSVNIQRADIIDATGLTLTQGQPVFIGSDGLLSMTPPATGWWQIIGFATSTTQIDILIREPVRLN